LRVMSRASPKPRSTCAVRRWCAVRR
jgi:hypothetical protein